MACSGERRLTEWEVPWLPGYQDAKPVRIGNAAYAQLQLDVFGEVMDALYQARRGGVDGEGVSWALQCKLLSHLETDMARAGFGSVGNARSATALYLLQGDDLGGLRSRREVDRAAGR